MSRTIVSRLMTLAMVVLCRLTFDRRVGVGDVRVDASVDVTSVGIVTPGTAWSSGLNVG